ncbi:MAG: DUF6962 family protein [Gammaproteobacteria bacterium]
MTPKLRENSNQRPFPSFKVIRSELWVPGLLLCVAVIVLFGLVPPIPQDPDYHNFAPSTLQGSNIPNTLNVITNVPLAIVGLWGLIYCWQSPQPLATWSWRFFFIGTALTSAGSAFYHWNPNDFTLAFDRAPMSIALMALFVASISEAITPELEDRLLTPLIIAGISSVLYWQYSDDLRAYGLVQFFPLVALPVIILLSPGRYDSQHYWFVALSFYVFAKIFEAYDYETRAWVGIGGHALKHLLAAFSAISLLVMLRTRRQVPARGVRR